MTRHPGGDHHDEPQGDADSSLTFPDGRHGLGGNVEAIYCAALQTQNPPCGGISLLARPPQTE